MSVRDPREGTVAEGPLRQWEMGKQLLVRMLGPGPGALAALRQWGNDLTEMVVDFREVLRLWCGCL